MSVTDLVTDRIMVEPHIRPEAIRRMGVVARGGIVLLLALGIAGYGLHTAAGSGYASSPFRIPTGIPTMKFAGGIGVADLTGDGLYFNEAKGTGSSQRLWRHNWYRRAKDNSNYYSP